jgi:hypothetical protein
MPQATPELCAKFPGHDAEAFEVIKANFTTSRGGVIYPKVVGYKMTEREGDAIDYLCDEWDYGFNPCLEGQEDKPND